MGGGRTHQVQKLVAIRVSVRVTASTDAMLTLGAHVGAWMERIIVIAFVLTAIGLALELV